MIGMHAQSRLLPLVLVICGLAAAPLSAAEDFHELFEERCAGCHGHAGNFARTSLELVEGKLRGRESGRAIAPSPSADIRITRRDRVPFGRRRMSTARRVAAPKNFNPASITNPPRPPPPPARRRRR